MSITRLLQKVWSQWNYLICIFVRGSDQQIRGISNIKFTIPLCLGYELSLCMTNCLQLPVCRSSFVSRSSKTSWNREGGDLLSERSNSRLLIWWICTPQKRTLTQNAASAARSSARFSPWRARDWLRSIARVCTAGGDLAQGGWGWGSCAYLMSTSQDEKRKSAHWESASLAAPPSV